MSHARFPTKLSVVIPTLNEAANVGAQLNAGAGATSGDVLLFLHADVAPPPDFALQKRMEDVVFVLRWREQAKPPTRGR